MKAEEGKKMPDSNIKVNGFILQNDPKIFVAMIPGNWLLAHTTPSWRIDNPEQGFQRMVKEERAREIALAVLDQQRTFPNSIVLATDIPNLATDDLGIELPNRIKFLVVDGQHRLWAQKFAKFNANYSCVIHLGLSEVDMARLFLEINDNQKRVPPSLRWDLVRLVRPDDDPYLVDTAEIILRLATEQESPLYQRIDLTGEQSEIQLKQASIAPEIKTILSKRSQFRELPFEERYQLIQMFFIAIKELDPDKWGNPDAPFFKARVLRALLRVFSDIVNSVKKPLTSLGFLDFLEFLKKINPDTLDTQKILAVQGSAGIKNIYDTISSQIFG